MPGLSIRKYRLRVCLSHAMTKQKSSFVSAANVISLSSLSLCRIVVVL